MRIVLILTAVLLLAACTPEQTAKTAAASDATIAQLESLKAQAEQAKADALVAHQDTARAQATIDLLTKAINIAEQAKATAIAATPSPGTSPFSTDNIIKILGVLGGLAITAYTARKVGFNTGATAGAQAVVNSIDAGRRTDPAIDAALTNASPTAVAAMHAELIPVPQAKAAVINTP